MTDNGAAGDHLAQLQPTVELQPSTREHATVEAFHCGQEATPARMAIGAHRRGAYPVLEQSPMPERRQAAVQRRLLGRDIQKRREAVQVDRTDDVLPLLNPPEYRLKLRHLKQPFAWWVRSGAGSMHRH